MNPEGALQFLATSLAYDDYVGRITIGKVMSGTLRKGGGSGADQGRRAGVQVGS